MDQPTTKGRRGHNRNFSLDEKRQIANEYESGLSAKAVGRKWTLCEARVLQIVREMGGQVRTFIQSSAMRKRSFAATAPEEEKQRIVRDYLAGRTVKELAAEMGRAESVVTLVLTNAGVPLRSPREAKELASEVLPPGVEEEILRRHAAGERLTTISLAVGVSMHFVRRTLRRHGKRWRTTTSKRVWYTCKHDYFADIDTEAKAYWLGMFCADGCIAKSKKSETWRLAFILSSKDAAHVKRFKKAIRATNPIKDRMIKASNGKWYPATEFILHSKRMAADLAVLGVVQNKVHRLTIPPVPPHLVRHLWRGWLDGDGSIIADAASPFFDLLGTQVVVTAFRDYVNANVYPTEAQPRSKGEFWSVTVGGSGLARAVAEHFYGDATVFLPRKMARALKIMRGCLPRPYRRSIGLTSPTPTVDSDAGSLRHPTGEGING